MPWLRPNPATREVLVVIGMTVAVELDLANADRATPVRAAAGLLITLPLAFRLRFPVTALAFVVAGIALGAALGADPVNGSIYPGIAAIAALLALYGVGSQARGARLVAGATVSFTGLLTASLLASRDVAGGLALSILVTAAGLVVGGALGVLRFESDQFAERASELERERDERARLAVADERKRIARELHDVIGHSISVMGVQAGAVRSVLRDDQRREREALLGVERTGRQAVGEMRRLIGLLRTEDDALGDPTPSLSHVEQLISDLRGAGLAIALSVEGDLSMLSPGVDLAGYRIFQEALTNSLKHAPGARVGASVTCTGGALEIEVVDDGDGAPMSRGDHVGQGLVGMRERVSLYGGKLITGPRPSGGFEVRAQIPFEVS